VVLEAGEERSPLLFERFEDRLLKGLLARLGGGAEVPDRPLEGRFEDPEAGPVQGGLGIPPGGAGEGLGEAGAEPVHEPGKLPGGTAPQGLEVGLLQRAGVKLRVGRRGPVGPAGEELAEAVLLPGNRPVEGEDTNPRSPAK